MIGTQRMVAANAGALGFRPRTLGRTLGATAKAKAATYPATVKAADGRVFLHVGGGKYKTQGDTSASPALLTYAQVKAWVADAAKPTTGAVKVTPSNPNVVRKGTRVSWRGSTYDNLGVPFIMHTQAELDSIRKYVEQGEYNNVRVASDYSYVIIEATLGRDKSSLEAIRDGDMAGSAKEGVNAVNYISKVGSVRDATISVTDAAPAVTAPRIPITGGGGGGVTETYVSGGGGGGGGDTLVDSIFGRGIDFLGVRVPSVLLVVGLGVAAYKVFR